MIAPHNDRVSHFSSTDENIRPGQGNSRRVQVIEQGYVKHHLHVARFQRELYRDGFIARVYDPTGDLACKINNVCGSVLVLGATESRKILDKTDLR